MNPLFKRQHVLGIAAAALLIGCSGGESGTGMQANQTTTGEITGFGSVYVNGIKFETNQATVSIDGVPSSENALSVGMVVTVTGSVDSDGVSGTANEISAKTEVEGLVFENNIATGGTTINVMGQIVKITNDTKFKSEVTSITTIDQLIANDTVVEVSGYSDGQGNIYATYIKALDSNEVKLHGVIQNLSGTNDNDSFTIGEINGEGGITVTFNAATTQFEDVTQDQLANGMYVSVESANYTSGTGAVLASEIELEDDSSVGGSEVDVEGVVTDVTNIGAEEFKINGLLVKFDPGTTFIGGDQSNIELEVKLEVEGTVQSDNSILADEISFRVESDMEAEGEVTLVDKESNSFELNDDVLGTLTIVVNEFTSYEDEIDEDNRTFNFDDIVQGMGIEAKYYVDSDNGNNIATSIYKVLLEP